MKLKKILIYGLSLVTIAALSIGGTIAYFTWEAETNNVAIVGNIKVEQLEYERVVDENGNWVPSNYTGYGYTADLMQPYTQGKKLLPKVGEAKWDDRNGSQNPSGEGSHQQSWSQVGAPGSNQLFDDSVKNVHDKFVFVKNTGSDDLYFRTIIAFEAPAEIPLYEGKYHAIMLNTNVNARFDWDKNIGYITVDGTRYCLLVATYNKVLSADEVARPSLLQYYMRSEVTQEEAKYFGKSVEILTFTQAVQASGFDSAEAGLNAAFGEISENNHPWIDGGVSVPEIISNADDLASETENGGTFMVCNSFNYSGSFKKPTKLMMLGNSIDSDGIKATDDFSIEGGSYVMDYDFDYIDIRPTDDSEFVFKNINFINNVKKETRRNSATNRVIDIVKFNAMADDINCKFIFENCTFNNASLYFAGLSDYSANVEIIIKNCTFNALTADRVIEIKNYLNGIATIEDCTFNLTCTTNSFASLEVSNSSSTTVEVTAKNNKLNAVTATPYTFDPAKGETAKDNVQLLYTPKNICFFDFRYLSGGYSSVNESGTILSGDIAVPSRTN